MTTGAFTYVGYGGYSWSSTVSSTSTYNLAFHYARLFPSDVDGHAYGFQVRCLRE